MAGVSDLPFRLLCTEQGAGCVSTEMVSAKAITYRNQKTRELMEISPKEHPVALQLFGSEPAIFAEAIDLIADQSFDILDINMGCPMPKIVNNQEGSALMKNPAKIEEIVRACVRACEKDPQKPPRPVTVKLRAGFDADHINAVECALAAQSGGASGVAVHARTKEQYYSGTADLAVIRSVKEALSIPVIGSGDVIDAQSAKRMFDETNADGIMIARAARGNPWIFQQIISALQAYEEAKGESGLHTGRQGANESVWQIPTVTDAQRKETMLRHARLLMEVKGEYIATRELRKHLAWYTAGRPGAARLRERMYTMESREEVEQMICEIFDK